ncbi:YgaP family membrane protein [Ahrensia kielensis]|uniref:YgaP family membrane protein n=1 Tax=Ahrensia kielensis TaxID=76980 RepID=UPI00035F2D76|nr:DUF2892 domain-containing protein [Ahrensia kielensis]
MTANLGTLDRLLRALVGIILLVVPIISNLAIFDSIAVTVIAAVAGVVMLTTSVIRFCPIYRIFGIRTCNL